MRVAAGQAQEAEPLFHPPDYRAARLFCALAIFTTLLGSTTPSPLYPLYVEQWSISQGAITVVFAIYTIGALIALRLTGYLKRRIGRSQAVLAAGMAVAGFGALVMALAPDLKVLFVGRFLTGLGTGAVSGVATASLYDLATGAARARATFFATITFTAGAAIGPIVSSFAIMMASAPTSVAYLPIVALSLATIAGIRLSSWPDSTAYLDRPGSGAGGSAKTQLAWPGLSRTPAFVVSVLVLSITWMIGSTLMALGSATALSAFGIRSVALTGLLPAMFQFLGGAGQYLFSRVTPRRSIMIGCVGLFLSQIAFVFAVTFDLAMIFAVAFSLCGLTYGAAFVGAVGFLNGNAIEDQRAALISNLYLVGYLVHWIPVIIVGLLSDFVGIPVAFVVFSVAAASAIFVIFRHLRDKAF